MKNKKEKRRRNKKE